MKHLEYMQKVADEDVRELMRKEQTYKGSWKQRGGVGAFMMMERKWDRLENMAKERGWDVFDRPGDGTDGTLIAEIRDLRRYLLLVEAELQSRWASVTAGIDLQEMQQRDMELRLASKPNPGNGGQHESLHPWIWSHRRSLPKEYGEWYHMVDVGWALEPYVGPSVELPDSLAAMYVHTEYGYVLKVKDCPPSARDYFPYLQAEANAFERGKMPFWQFQQYEWCQEQDKFIARKEWIA